MHISIATTDLSNLGRFLGRTNSQSWCGRRERSLLITGVQLAAVHEDEDGGDHYYAIVTISERRHATDEIRVATLDFTEIEALEHLGVDA